MTKTVCVIGAGCSGITAVKNLVQAGISDVTCFEQQSEVGGNWIYSSKIGHSSVCSTTHIISSKRMSEYSDFQMPEEYPDYPSHKQVLAYFQSYARHFNVEPYIKFNISVEKITKNENGNWEVKTSDGRTDEFNYLLVSSGHHSVPRHPDLPGKFEGEYIHSHEFKNNTPFAGKKVLVIGAGNSGCDCAVECSRVSEDVTISMRSPQYIIPKFFLGKPTDTFNKQLKYVPEFIAGFLRNLTLKIQIGDYNDYGLPNPDYPIIKDHPTLNSELLYKIRHGKVRPKPGISQIEGKNITFTDNSNEDFDVIIAATGYKISTPFFSKDFVDFEDTDRVPLYLRMFHPKHRNLIFIGMVQPQGAIWPLSDAQSQLAANYIIGNYQLPPNIEQLAEKECDRIEREFLKKKRHTIEVHYHPYLNKLKNQIPKNAPQWK